MLMSLPTIHFLRLKEPAHAPWHRISHALLIAFYAAPIFGNKERINIVVRYFPDLQQSFSDQDMT